MGLVWLSHVLIDYAKFFLAPKFTNGRWPAYLFTVDQFCHYLLAYSGFIFLNHYKAYQYHFQALF